MGSFTCTFDTAALTAQIDALREDVQAAIRPAAQAGAQVLYEAVKANTPRSTKGHWFHGTSFKLTGKKYWYDAGTLQRAIYQVYSKENSGVNQARYHISWNHKKVPYGHMVEYGTVKSPPVAFVRGARSKIPVALEAAKQELFNRLKHFK